MKNLKTKSILLMLPVILALNSACSIIEKTELLTSDPVQYEKTELQVGLKTDWTNPYDANEIALDMIINTPSGAELILPCFYESGVSGASSVWKARFAAREAGIHTFYFILNKAGEAVETTDPGEFNVSPSNGKGFLNPNDLWTLRYDNGDLFRGIGENICWESRDEDDSKFFEALHEDKRFNYDYMLNKLVANGGNFFRTWMIYWNLPIDWKTVNNNSRYQNTTSAYNESGMERMDKLVERCDSLNIHMMLALESHVGYMGMGWDISSYNVANGGTAKTPLEFFTLESAKAQYKNKLRLMVARYGYSPSIGAWEFFNEVDNAMYHGKPEDRIPDSAVTVWHDQMSTYLKTIDPYKHIVTTSVSHRDVTGMNDLKNIDINQRHMYKNTDGIPSSLNEYSQKHNKPYVIGESGYEWDWSKNFNDFADEFDNDFRRGLWYGLFSPTPVLPMSWWWEFFENRGMMEYFNLVRTISDDMIEAGKGAFNPMELKSTNANLKIYGVTCGEKSFVYLYNPTEKASTIELNTKISSNLQAFNCKTGAFSVVKYAAIADNSIEIEQLKLGSKEDVILIWE